MAGQNPGSYHVGILCALKIEQAAVLALLDEEYGLMDEKDAQDHNVYYTGRIHNHKVVVACLPAGVDGIAAAATVAKDMIRTFTQLRYGLMVGIGGGIPDLAHLSHGIDIRLGDVVVSQPVATHGGVIQYDKGKLEAKGKWKPKGTLGAPPKALLTALQALQTRHELEESVMGTYIFQMIQKRPKMRTNGYVYPGADKDVLYTSSENYDTSGGTTSLDQNLAPMLEKRIKRPTTDPQIHYGTIVSGNAVVKDALFRDKLLLEHGALCVEMEAAGLMNDFPCLVIRGICDYADRHKNDDWHRYAATTAAAFAKELLLYVSIPATSNERPITMIQETLDRHFQKQEKHYTEQHTHNQWQEIQYDNDRLRKCHQVFRVCDYEGHKSVIKTPVQGTCKWALDHPNFRAWQECANSDLLWLSADPGCGKSVLSRYLIDTYLTQPELEEPSPAHISKTICYYFFKDSESQDSLSTALCTIIHQLFCQQPRLIRYALPAYDENGAQVRTNKAELWQILQRAANDADASPIICVLDALDECCDAERSQLIDFLCQFYRDSQRAPSNSRFKWLVTSRPYEDISDQFGQITTTLPSIRLRGEEENDAIREEINTVIHARVNELSRKFRLSSSMAQRMEKDLLQMENRTYLWLYLVMNEIEQALQGSLRPNEEPLPYLPSSVPDAYEKILARVRDPREQQNAKTVLMIIIGAKRPLRVSEMALALDIATLSTAPTTLAGLTVNPDGLLEKIRRWCGLFVFVNHDKLYLLHQTAKEFLLARSDSLIASTTCWRHCLQPIDIETTMARIFTDFMCLDDFNQSQIRGIVTDSQFDFFIFAAKHWVSSIRSADSNVDDRMISKLELLYDTSSQLFLRWTKFPWDDTGHRWAKLEMNKIQLGAFNGHNRFLEYQLKEGRDIIDSLKDSDRTALSWAAERGHLDTVQILLNHGASVDIPGKHANALTRASRRGYEKIVQLLLDHGANVNHRAGVQYGTPLFEASVLGHEKVVQLLINYGAEVNAQGKSRGHRVAPRRNALPRASIADKAAGGTALHAASLHGHENIVRILLDHDADTSILLQCRYTALEIAVQRGHKGIEQMLRQKLKEDKEKAAGPHDGIGQHEQWSHSERP